MLFKYCCLVMLLFAGTCTFGQVIFEDFTEIYMEDVVVRSALPLGLFDINGDYQDDIVTLNEGNILSTFINQGTQAMSYHLLQAPVSGTPEWSFTAGDLDNDGNPEVIVTGLYNNVKVYKYNPEEQEFTLFQKFSSQAYGQGSNIVDINRDGFNDYFLCHDEGESRLFINDGTGKLSLLEGLLDFTTDPASDMSGNYGSEWVDIDDDGVLELYMAKCSVRASEYTDPRRINQLFKINDQGVYKDIANDIGLAYGDQSWAATFSDLDNDGDLDCIIVNHHSPHLFLENIDGNFVEKDIGVGDIVSFAFQVTTADFDNNGYEDILITGGSDHLLLNRGGFEFELTEEVFSFFDVHSASIADINDDGLLDAYVSYGIPIQEPGNRRDAIWINNSARRNFVKLTLKGVTSNASAIGAKIKLYSDLGVQQRNIKGGQSYGIVNSFNQHFGMGDVEVIDSVIVTWPSGEVEMFYNLATNAHYLIQEGNCINEIIDIVDESAEYCLGCEVSIVIEVPQRYTNVLWHDGFEGNERTMINPVSFSFTATDEDGCTVASKLEEFVQVGKDFYSFPYGDSLTICEGDMIAITDSDSLTFTWNTGDSSRSITPLIPGNYTVTVTNLCGKNFQDSVIVDFFHSDLKGSTDTIKKFEVDTIIVSNENIRWYASALSDEILFEGDTFITPVLEETTSYFWEAVSNPEGIRQNVGIPESIEGTPYSADHLNAVMRFDVFDFITIHNVTCYTDMAGDREIVITDREGIEIFRKRFTLTDGENKLPLNATLYPGDNYRITTDTALNNAEIGFDGPRLHRTAEGVFYPYKIDGLLSIEGSENGPNYYYFYDWDVEAKGEPCISDRVEAKVVVDFNESTNETLYPVFNIYPNPATDLLYIDRKEYSEYNRLAIYSSDGVLVHRDILDAKVEVINIGRLPPGIYFIRLDSRSDSFLRKFVVMK